MLVNLKDILAPALVGNYAVGCFNVFGYEDALAVTQAAQKRGASAILSINLDMTQFMPLNHIVAMFKPLAEDANVPICLHLDHHYEIEKVKQAVEAGFTSVMYDGSQLAINDNIAGIQTIHQLAKQFDVSIEAEVGSVPYASGRDHIKSELTDLAEAQAMAQKGQPDALAISIGNIHRLENEKVTINYDLLAKLEKGINIPLVIHGTSGIKDEDIQQLAQTSVCKFNIGTCLRQRFGQSFRQSLNDDPNLFDRLTLMKAAIPSIEQEADKMIALLGQ